MTGRSRANGEGSIFPYRNGYAAYSWVHTPDGPAQEEVGLRQDPRGGPHPSGSNFRRMPLGVLSPTNRRPKAYGEYLDYWQREIVAAEPRAEDGSDNLRDGSRGSTSEP